jgi:hypothetical protein
VPPFSSLRRRRYSASNLYQQGRRKERCPGFEPGFSVISYTAPVVLPGIVSFLKSRIREPLVFKTDYTEVVIHDLWQRYGTNRKR